MNRASAFLVPACIRLPATLLAGLALAGVAAAAEPEQRAVWANYRAIQTPAALAQTVARVVGARLNAIYVPVWYNGGQAACRSALGPMMQDTPADYDPLGALITAAHAKNIHVHDGQQALCRAYAARGTCYFSMDQFSEALATALAAGPYPQPAAPYYPGP
jgi:hypothetical protein